MADPSSNSPLGQRILQRAKNLAETLGWIAALIGSISAIAGGIPTLATTASSVIDAVFHPLPNNVAVFLGDDPAFANQYIAILAERGFDARFEPLSRIKDVTNSTRPGLIVLSKSSFNNAQEIVLDDETRHQLIGNTKIIGIGNYGADVIHELDPASMLGGVAQVNQTAVIADDPDKPTDIGQGLPTDKPIKLYDQDMIDQMLAASAYDSGSTAIQQPRAQGIARVSSGEPRDRCKGAYWSVAIQGDFALWGYRLPAASLTAEGRQLFGDLAVHLRQTPFVRLERQFMETEPGDLQGTLGCSLISQIYRFRPAASGAITVKASADHPIAVILNAPYQIGYLGRQDGLKPQFTVQVQPDQLQRPGYWTIGVKYFGAVAPDTHFTYSLDLNYPYSKKRPALWLTASGIALVLGLLALARLIVIFRRRPRQAPAPST